ncbi:MAG TPA: hypothetical protein VGF67_01225 [Ktedonobacteraceae bacterium]|jgi:hypothetical protein
MSTAPLMDKGQIIQNLKLLGEELEALQLTQPVRLLMIGGGYMLTQIGNRPFTEDVDVFTRLDRYSEDYWRFRSAIHFIAADTHLSQKWVTDNIGDFMEILGPVPEGTLWLKHGLLEVSIPEPHYILLLKLLAGREKDLQDIWPLCTKLRLTRREQAEQWLRRQVAMYQFDQLVVEDYRENINRMFARVFRL